MAFLRCHCSLDRISEIPHAIIRGSRGNESLGHVIGGGQQIRKQKFDRDSAGDAKTVGERMGEYNSKDLQMPCTLTG